MCEETLHVQSAPVLPGSGYRLEFMPQHGQQAEEPVVYQPSRNRLAESEVKNLSVQVGCCFITLFYYIMVLH